MFAVRTACLRAVKSSCGGVTNCSPKSPNNAKEMAKGCSKVSIRASSEESEPVEEHLSRMVMSFEHMWDSI